MNTELLKSLYANIFEMLGIQDLPEERKQKILNDLVEILEERIFLRVVDQLKNAAREEFAKVLTDETATNEQKLAFIHNHMPNFPEFMEEEIALFKKELKEDVDEEVVEDILTIE